MDGAKERGIPAIKERFDQCANIRVPPGRGTVVPRHRPGDVGTGAVLSQMQDGEERVIAYVSKSLEGSEQRYCTARKELLAVVRAFGQQRGELAT